MADSDMVNGKEKGRGRRTRSSDGDDDGSLLSIYHSAMSQEEPITGYLCHTDQFLLTPQLTV